MADGADALDRLGAALRAGDRAAVVACFGPGAVLVVPQAGDELRYAGAEALGVAVASVCDAFSGLDYTPLRRYLTPTQTVEEATLSGHHVGTFVGRAPAGASVRVNVRLVGEVSADGTLRQLAVWPDLPSLWSQLGQSVTAADAANAAVSAARDQRSAELRVVHGADRVPGAAPPPPQQRKRQPTRWITIAVIALLAAGATATAAFGHLLGSRSTAAHVGLAGSPQPDTSSGPGATATPSGLPAIVGTAPSATPVVQRGQQLVLSADVLFDFGSGTLTPAADTALVQLANRIRAAHVQGVIQINGYTDNVGPDAYDLALSRTRALAVAVALQHQLGGVPVILDPQGFGKADPVATNATADGRARNRRVTIVLPVAH